MNSFTIKVLGFFVSIFIIITVVSQIVSSFSQPLKTIEANYVNITHKVNFDCVFLRDETVLQGSISNGVVSYIQQDASKLEKGATVLQVFASELDIINSQRLEEINNEISQLEKIINPGLEISAQPEFVSKQIDEMFSELHYYLALQDFEKVKKIKTELSFLMSVFNIITNAEDKKSFADRISLLNKEKADLSVQISPPISTINSEQTGYYISYVDGYENILNEKDFLSLTYDEIAVILNDDIKKNYNTAGKVAKSYNSYIVGVANVSAQDIQGKNIKLKINGNLKEYPVVIEKKENINDQDLSLIYLSCDVLDYELVQNRVENATLIFNEYSGIKVPRDAICFVDGKKGVYTVDGEKLKFKQIETIFEGKDFVISDMKNENSYLELYDIILLEEVELNESADKSSQSEQSTDSNLA